MNRDYDTIGNVITKQDKQRLKMFYLKPCLLEYSFDILYINYRKDTGKMWVYCSNQENYDLIIDYPLFEIRFLKKELDPEDLVIKLIIKAMETEDDLARNNLCINSFVNCGDKKIRDFFISYGKTDRRMIKRFELIMGEYITEPTKLYNIADKTMNEVIKLFTI